MKCAQCGADNRGGAKFCEQCGTKIEAAVAGAAPILSETSTGTDNAPESMVDEVVEAMAKEPGTTKGPGFKLALIFLLLILLAGVLWAYMGRGDGPQGNPASSNVISSDNQETGPLKAPSLAEQMGTSVTPVMTDALDSKAAPASPQEKSSTDSKRTKDAKTKAQRDDEQRKKNEEVRLAQEEKEAAARKAALTVKSLSTAQEVANCEKMSVFARQPCLWRACNGKWGKDGCPSYD